MKNELNLFRSDFWNPMKDLSEIQRGFQRLFHDFRFMPKHESGDLAMTPACNIEETDTQYSMSFDLPGVKKDDINIELSDHALTVSGERKEERKEDKKSRHIYESYYGNFQRVIALPSVANSDQIQASFNNGVLKLTIPKSETEKRKLIKISESKSQPGTTSVRITN